MTKAELILDILLCKSLNYNRSHQQLHLASSYFLTFVLMTFGSVRVGPLSVECSPDSPLIIFLCFPSSVAANYVITINCSEVPPHIWTNYKEHSMDSVHPCRTAQVAEVCRLKCYHNIRGFIPAQDTCVCIHVFMPIQFSASHPDDIQNMQSGCLQAHIYELYLMQLSWNFLGFFHLFFFFCSLISMSLLEAHGWPFDSKPTHTVLHAHALLFNKEEDRKL